MGNLANNENEELALINVLGIFIPVVLGAAGMWVAAQSAKVATWMLGNNIMVPSEESLIAVTDTAGVDLLRVVTFAAVVCTVGFAFARFSPRKKSKHR